MAKNKNRKHPTPEKLFQQQENSLRINRLRDELNDWLIEQPERMARKNEFLAKIGPEDDARQLLADDGVFIVFERKHGEWWVQRLADYNLLPDNRFEKEREDSINEEWQPFVKLCGVVSRFDSGKPESSRVYVITHTFIEEKAAKKLALSLQAITDAAKAGDLPSFVDPSGMVRIPAQAIESALKDVDRFEAIARHEMISVRHISLVSGLSYTVVKEKLMKSSLSLVNPTWGQVRGKWGLPETIKAYKAILADRLPLWQAGVAAQKHEQSGRAASAINRGERKRLSQQLYENFPTWENYDREDQLITLHLGPTNSGKTYQSISRLIEAGSGWYLAPLRLLAHEVFDTLNKKGVACNLLTGEESIRVDGAQITAATIEMFNPDRSGACVVIDEAQMLTDTQRGWAWTRAIMETRSNEVHITGAPIVQPLVESLADVAGFEISVESYERLTPLEVAPKPWSMATLPARTILVAFSRRMVLALKNELEKTYKRTVSVIYGNLPPEVRLKQAERFATGQTEICVATDAIGMGLNLPADHVCFYETSKFDGVEVRKLTDNEIRQIGGRAGRYGLSENGWVGALNKPDIEMIRKAVASNIPAIEYARVAPTPESIAILPGELYEKLEKWMSLQGIPQKWKEILKPMDLSGQIELAKMLSSRDVQRLGDDAALVLINAPCYRETQQYWQSCAYAIIRRRAMPLPEAPEATINSASDLERHEIAIRCADIYLWLSQRKEFASSGPLADEVRSLRRRLTLEVDAALLRKIDTTRRCRDCGRSLPVGYQFNICQRCYHERRNGYFDY